jgi:mannose/cellobiose epimerase-like protein (N-acyl-D-glucosamine 2-epimerase family)
LSSVRQAAEAARAWLSDAALPLWGSAGVDKTGSFHERLGFDGRPDLQAPRRLRVEARQLYVFSEASVRGWWGPARSVADAGFEAFVRDCWAPDGKPGLLHELTADRRPLDLTRDAYDHAFGLFGLAWYYKASKSPRALALAHEMLDFLERDMADPVHGGFVESLPPALPRRSDPHMHLLEAMLEWSEACDDPRFSAAAARLVELFRTRFFDEQTGTLGEYFGLDLRPAGAEGEVVAPGHQFEWFWLLDWAARLGLGDCVAQGRRLYDFGLRKGCDALGFALDETDRQGRLVRASRRAWPQTELIKAHLCAARHGQAGAAEAAAALTQAFFGSYLATGTPGLWMDQFDDGGRPMTPWAPATTLYHVQVAFRELILFAEAAGA